MKKKSEGKKGAKRTGVYFKTTKTNYFNFVAAQTIHNIAFGII
jgi:hypothetical protein